MNIKSQFLFLLLVIIFVSFITTNDTYAFGFLDNVKKNTGGLLSSPKKSGSESKVENVEDLMSDIIREIMPANNIESRGRSMLVDALITVKTTEKIMSDTTALSGYISKMTDSLVKLSHGETIIVDSAKDFQNSFIQQNNNFSITCNDLNALKKETEKEGQNVSDTKRSLSEAIVDKANRAITKTNETNNQFDEIDKNVSNIEKNAYQLNSDFQGDVLRFYAESDSFEKKLEKFSNTYVRPAIKGIGYTVGYMKGLTSDFPKIKRSIEIINKKAKKNGQELITEGVKVLGILAIQKDNIQKLIMQLKEDPINNLNNINKLKKISDDIFFFIKTINKYNTAIKNVNEQLNIAANNIASVNNRLRNANIHSKQILDGITNAYTNVLNKL